MNEIPRIPWERVISHFVWILGSAIILATFSYHEFLAHVQRAKRIKVFKRNTFKKPFILGLILIAVGISTSSLLQIFSAKSEVILLKDMVKIFPSSLSGHKKIEGDLIAMPWNGKIMSKKIKFEKSKYEIRIISKGSKALEETARLKVYIGLNLIGDYFTSTEYEEKIFEFKSGKNQLRRLIIEFVNDYNDPVTNQDRNAWIKSIVIIKMDDIFK